MSYGGFALSATTPAAERVMRYIAVDVETRCWNWLGHVASNGYGRVCPTGKRTLYAHRYSYEAFVGPIPAGMQLDHLCRNKRCVNPAHLEAVTPLVNTQRSEGNGRKTHCPQGHAYSEHGRIYQGRRHCRPCNIARCREWKAQERQRRAATWAKYHLGETA